MANYSILYLNSILISRVGHTSSIITLVFFSAFSEALRFVNASRRYITLTLSSQLMFLLLCCLHHANPSPSIELRRQSRKAYQPETQGVPSSNDPKRIWRRQPKINSEASRTEQDSTGKVRATTVSISFCSNLGGTIYPDQQQPGNVAEGEFGLAA